MQRQGRGGTVSREISKINMFQISLVKTQGLPTKESEPTSAIDVLICQVGGGTQPPSVRSQNCFFPSKSKESCRDGRTIPETTQAPSQ